MDGVRHVPPYVREQERVRVAQRGPDRLQQARAAVDADRVRRPPAAVERPVGQRGNPAVDGARAVRDDVRRSRVRAERRGLRPGHGLVVERADVRSRVDVGALRRHDDVEPGGRREPHRRGAAGVAAAVRPAPPAEAVRERDPAEVPARRPQEDPFAGPRLAARLEGELHLRAVERAPGVGVLVGVDGDQQRDVAALAAAPARVGLDRRPETDPAGEAGESGGARDLQRGDVGRRSAVAKRIGERNCRTRARGTDQEHGARRAGREGCRHAPEP